MSSKESIGGFILDMDGTILDSMGIWHDLGKRFLEDRGIRAEEGLSLVLYPMSLEGSSSYLKEHYGLLESTEEIQAGFLSIVERFYMEEAPLKDGAYDFVRSCAQRGPVVLATTSPLAYAHAALSRGGVMPYIKSIFTCSQFDTSKSEPVIYQKAAQFMELVPSQVLVVEDMRHALLTAKKAGFLTLAVFDESAKEQRASLEKEADWYVDNLRAFWE